MAEPGFDIQPGTDDAYAEFWRKHKLVPSEEESPKAAKPRSPKPDISKSPPSVSGVDPRDDPFRAAIEAALERAGTATPEDQKQPAFAWKSVDDLIQGIDAAMDIPQRTNDLLYRGFQQKAANMNDIALGAVRLLKRGVQADKKLNDERPYLKWVPSVLSVLSDGAGYLVQKYGGTKDGALDLLERQLARQSEFHR